MPVFLSGESHGQRSLVGCSPRGRKVRHDWATNTFTFSTLNSLYHSVTCGREGKGMPKRFRLNCTWDLLLHTHLSLLPLLFSDMSLCVFTSLWGCLASPLLPPTSCPGPYPTLNTPWRVEFYLKSNLSDFFWSFSPGNWGGNFIWRDHQLS